MENMKRKHAFLCALILVILAFVGFFAWGGKDAAPEKSIVAEMIEPESESKGNRVLVYIVGAVKEPGVYELPEGSRVYDAVVAAGNVIPYADVESVNMSELLADAAKIYIPLAPEQTNPTAEGMVNINQAAEAELKTLSGIGEKTAEKIIEYRNEHGGFKTKEELKEVPTIGEGKYAKVAGKITL